jgi:diguanylate cyclase (GGDEF)-like protein
MATILVVDDHSANRKLIKAVLGDEAYRVLEASDGSEGLAKARVEHPDLIITDVLMPTMDGFEFVRQLRADASLAQTPVIFYTATYLESEARQLAHACGVTHLILKPAEPQEILSTVHAALDLKEPAPSYDLAEDFDREHLRIITNKLLHKVDELEEINLRLTQEMAQRWRAELALRASQERIERLSSIREVSSDINSVIVRIRNRHELLQEAARVAVKHGEFSMVAISLVDSASAQLARAACAEAETLYGRSLGTPFPTRGQAVHEIAEAALARREPVLCNDIELEGRMESWKKQTLARGHRAAVALPLIATQNVMGVIEFYASKTGFFNETEIGLLQDLAADLSFALQYIDNEEKINYLAYYDNLSGLPNRTLFCDRVNQVVHAARDAKIRAGMIVLDLERFSIINDTFGRHAGDALLKQVTERLTGKVKNTDWLAKISRSCFAVCLPSIKDDAEIAHFLEDVMREIAGAPFLVEGEEMRVTLTCGASVFPPDGKDAEKLLSNAETALQRAQSSADRYLFFTAQMNARMAEKLTLENRLQRAIQNDEFVLYYQPIIDAHTKRITRLEGLLRWNHPEKGLVPPAAFIPVLEESGLIVDAGKWVLQRAAVDYQNWARRLAHPPRVSVNISPLQLKQKAFAVSVAEAAAKFHADALELEITESILMEDMEQNIQKLQKLKELGVDIVIDDFGTGYSSLSYLAKLPVSTLKIDRSFIFDLEKNPKSMSIVTAIISLAHSLDLKVVAEGVETEQQLQLLQALKCDEI